MANKVKFGLKNAHYAKIIDTDGVITYATPVPIPGSVALTLSAKGDKSEFYADDYSYFNETVNQGYEGDFEIALIPDTFKKDILGYVEDKNGVFFEAIDAKQSAFALLYEFDGDSNATRRVLYNCSCGRPSAEDKTKEGTITPSTDKLTLTASKALDSSYVKAEVKNITAQKVQYDAFFAAVYKYVPVV